MSSRERIAILGLYRQLLQHAKVYPKEKYELLLHEARAGFGNKKHITERKRIQEAIKAGESRLSFLKMTLPVAYIRELKRKAERQQHMVRGPETAAEFIEENKNDYVVVESKLIWMICHVVPHHDVSYGEINSSLHAPCSQLRMWIQVLSCRVIPKHSTYLYASVL